MLNLMGVYMAALAAASCLGPATNQRAGDRPPARSGTVIQSDTLKHLDSPRAPELPLQGPAGRETTVRQSARAVYVLAFVQVAGDCCHFSPRLKRLSDELAGDGVSVIQISLPGGACPLDDQAAQACPTPDGNRHRFFDPMEIAWIAFGLPRPGTVFLIHDDVIKGVAELDDLGLLGKRAKSLARKRAG